MSQSLDIKNSIDAFSLSITKAQSAVGAGNALVGDPTNSSLYSTIYSFYSLYTTACYPGDRVIINPQLKAIATTLASTSLNQKTMDSLAASVAVISKSLNNGAYSDACTAAFTPFQSLVTKHLVPNSSLLTSAGMGLFNAYNSLISLTSNNIYSASFQPVLEQTLWDIMSVFSLTNTSPQKQQTTTFAALFADLAKLMALNDASLPPLAPMYKSVQTDFTSLYNMAVAFLNNKGPLPVSDTDLETLIRSIYFFSQDNIQPYFAIDSSGVIYNQLFLILVELTKPKSQQNLAPMFSVINTWLSANVFGAAYTNAAAAISQINNLAAGLAQISSANSVVDFITNLQNLQMRVSETYSLAANNPNPPYGLISNQIYVDLCNLLIPLGVYDNSITYSGQLGYLAQTSLPALADLKSQLGLN